MIKLNLSTIHSIYLNIYASTVYRIESIFLLYFQVYVTHWLAVSGFFSASITRLLTYLQYKLP